MNYDKLSDMPEWEDDDFKMKMKKGKNGNPIPQEMPAKLCMSNGNK